MATRYDGQQGRAIQGYDAMAASAKCPKARLHLAATCLSGPQLPYSGKGVCPDLFCAWLGQPLQDRMWKIRN
jgi:hypothetical protein